MRTGHLPTIQLAKPFFPKNLLDCATAVNMLLCKTFSYGALSTESVGTDPFQRPNSFLKVQLRVKSQKGKGCAHHLVATEFL